MKLYAHQQKFLDKNPRRAMLVWETGTGKTVASIEWLKKRQGQKALVVCPKGIILKWKNDLKKWGGVADVVSRDEVKKVDLSKYKVLIIDEAQDFSAPLFEKGRSQRATAIYKFIKSTPDAHLLLLTATPVRSTPWNLHTLACYLGVYWDVKDFRAKFFYMTDMYGRLHYEKQKNWRTMLRPYLEYVSDIVLMSDCVDIPKQTHEIIEIEQEEYKTKHYEEPIKEWHQRHRAEQGPKKFAELNKILSGYRKVIVVCYYLSQIEDYKKAIGGDREVFVLTGSTKNQGEIIQQANESDDCVFLIQAGLGSGFDADKFSVMVFASMPFSYVHYTQMCGRIKRIHNLHENKYIYLLGGKCDEAVYKTIQSGKDFDPIAYLAGSTGGKKKKGAERDTESVKVVEDGLPF
jgi:superfamily II DNA or RNA helicase